MKTATAVVWKGTQHESVELCVALARHCTCDFNADGCLVVTCAGHAALSHEQRFLDGLVTYRHLRTQLLAEEFVP